MAKSKFPLTKKHGDCKKILPTLFDKVYKYDDNIPRIVDYAKAYADYKTKADRLPEGKSYDTETFRSTVSRALSQLKRDKIVRIDERTGRYVPNNDKYSKYLIKKEILNKVIFTKKDVMKIGNGAYVVAVYDDKNHERILLAQSLFKQYFENKYFSITVLDGALLFLVNEDENSIYSDLKNIVYGGINYEVSKKTSTHQQ